MLCIIGCGNSNRCDDGVGVFVAQSLKRHLQLHPRPDVRVFDAGTGGLDVMFQARGAAQLIIVDACNSGSQAGAIFKVPGGEWQGDADIRVGLHEFRWQHALAVGRKIFGAAFPTDVIVFLIEADSLDFGLELSAPVREAAGRVAIEIQQIILERSHHGPVAAESITVGTVEIARGNIYLPREICDAYFAGVSSVALIVREGAIQIVPLSRDSAGGLLLKQRNARGDRVVHAQEFIREQGYPESFEPRTVAIRWNGDLAALSIVTTRA